jgi:CRISPR system Cascade subunit CasE
MYLTRLRLDPAHPLARRDLASAYEMHRTLSRAFVPSHDAAPARFLWRLEPPTQSAADGPAVVLVQAAAPAHWQVLDEWPGYLRHAAEEKPVDLDRLLVRGRPCWFRLLCNPTATRNGKRLGLVREGDQREWLLRQGAKHGFEPAGVRICRSERISWRQGRGGQRITVQVVQFDGLLRVADPGPMAVALSRGIGHGKALGLGMLSLAPQPQGS